MIRHRLVRVLVICGLGWPVLTNGTTCTGQEPVPVQDSEALFPPFTVLVEPAYQEFLQLTDEQDAAIAALVDEGKLNAPKVAERAAALDSPARRKLLAEVQRPFVSRAEGVLDESQRATLKDLGFLEFANPIDNAEFHTRAIQGELQLTSDQRQRLRELKLQAVCDGFRLLREDKANESPTDRGARLRRQLVVATELAVRFREPIARILTPEQGRRWREVRLQESMWKYGPDLFVRFPDLVKSLELTEQQKTRIEELAEEEATALKSLPSHEFFSTRRQGVMEAVALLSERQRAEWTRLQGTPVDWQEYYPWWPTSEKAP